VPPSPGRSHLIALSRMKNHPGQLTLLSGRWDLNPGPLAPHASALAGLRHAPYWRKVFYFTGRKLSMRANADAYQA
jgi:hypothetical protein